MISIAYISSFNNMISTNIGIFSISHLKIRTNIDILAKAFVLFCHFPNSDSDSIPCHIAPAFLKVSCLSQRFAKASFYISYQNPWAEQTMSKLQVLIKLNNIEHLDRACSQFRWPIFGQGTQTIFEELEPCNVFFF